MKFKLIRDWDGFGKGQVIELKSPSRINVMYDINPPGIEYVEPKPEPIKEQPEIVIETDREPENLPAVDIIEPQDVDNKQEPEVVEPSGKKQTKRENSNVNKTKKRVDGKK